MSRCAVAFEDGSVCGILASTTNKRGLPVCIDHAPKCQVCLRPLLMPSPDGLHQGCFVAEGFKAMTEMLQRDGDINIPIKASKTV